MIVAVCQKQSLDEARAAWSPQAVAELAMIHDEPREFVYSAMLCSAFHLLAAGATVDEVMRHGKAIADEAKRRVEAADWGTA